MSFCAALPEGGAALFAVGSGGVTPLIPSGAVAPPPLEQQGEAFPVTFFGLLKGTFFYRFLCLVKESGGKKSLRRQGQSPLRRRRGAHGQRGSHVGAAGYWQRLQLPGPLTLYPQNRSLLRQFDPAPQTSAVMQAGASTPWVPGTQSHQFPMSCRRCHQGAGDYIQRARCRWMHRRFNWMHEPVTVAGSLKKLNERRRPQSPASAGFFGYFL